MKILKILKNRKYVIINQNLCGFWPQWIHCFFFQLLLISWMVTLSSYLIWQIISFILPPNEYGCVYAWTTLGNIATDRLTEDADFDKKNHLFRWSSFWSWQVYSKQAKLSHLGHRKPARIHWKADAPKTSHCLVRILVQGHNWAIFFLENEQGEAVTVNGDRYRAMLNEFLFTKIEEGDIGNIWFQQDSPTCHTAEATVDVLRPFLKIMLIMLKNWTDRVGYCRRDSHLNEIIFHY